MKAFATPSGQTESNDPATAAHRRGACERYGAHRFAAKPGVRLTEDVADALDAIALASRPEIIPAFCVSSARRTAHSQAKAMFRIAEITGRLAAYRNVDAAREILDEYRKSKRSADAPRRTIARMAAVIAAQVQRNVFISRHLVSDACDLSVRGLSDEDIALLLKAARASAKVAFLEKSPPHIHIQEFGR